MSNQIISLICEGDSLTAIARSATGSYVYGAAGIDPTQYLGQSTNALTFWLDHIAFRFKMGDMICANMSLGGSRILTNPPTSGENPGDLIYRASTIDALVNSSYPSTNSPLSIWENARPTRKYIFSIMIGTNPDTADPTGHCNNLKNYLNARLVSGSGNIQGLVVGTLLPRGDAILTNEAGFETYRQGINTILRTWNKNTFTPSPVSFALADFGAQPIVGASGACDNTGLFSDQVHPTDLGYSYMIPIYQNALSFVKSGIGG